LACFLCILALPAKFLATLFPVATGNFHAQST
jgi:hypothetical protein